MTHGGSTITTDTLWPAQVSPDEVRDRAQAHLDGLATGSDVAWLHEHENAWIVALQQLRDGVQATLERIDSQVTGPERELVLADFGDELARIDDRLTSLTGTRPDASATGDEAQRQDATRGADNGVADDPSSDVATLQLSWHDGQVMAWAAGARADALDEDAVRERLAAAGAATVPWQPHEPLALPNGTHATAVSAPVEASLGWLVSLNSRGADATLGASAVWLGLTAAMAVRLVAHGRMVPQLEKMADARGNRSVFAVRWQPTLIEHDELAALARSMPGAVAVRDRRRTAQATTRLVIADFVDVICREAADRIEVPAAPPNPQTATHVAEAVLARLNGSHFEAPHHQGKEVGKALKSWAGGVTGATKLGLVVQLDPPDSSGAWLLRTLASEGHGKPEPVEPAMSRAKHQRKETIKQELERLEGLYPPLERTKATRRGEVALGTDEAWELMTTVGPMLTAAGFDVRVPPLSTSKPTASLRVTSAGAADAGAGAQKLADVTWSAVFGDTELTAADIARLAGESRPLIKSHGRWVEVNHADLEAAAAALEERSRTTQLSGADLFRYALGLDGSALGRTVSVAGSGWATDLLASAKDIPEQPPTRPDGFHGELRAYQANALAWLDFLDGAGLGGILALDMGLGKTPTVLAHLRRLAGRGPALVVAPPAVVGNWAAEARRFVPDLDVVVHHGAGRAHDGGIAAEVADADVLLTTYGTAVRDIEALADMSWETVVVDEAQVIKNPASETAQQLRRLQARTRVVLTGTPIENGLGDLWALLDFVNPGLVGDRAPFVAQLSETTGAKSQAEDALRTLNGVLVFRRTKAEPSIAEELPDRIDELDHCPMTPEQIGLYQAVLDELVLDHGDAGDGERNRKGAVLAAITALKQICNHPAAYTGEEGALDGRSGKLARLEEIVDNVFASGERMLIFTHFATWGERLAQHLTARTGVGISCYHGGLSRTARDRMVADFQQGEGAGALVLSLKAGGTGLNLTAASHVVLYDRWWNPAVEDQARDRVWRIGQTRTVVSHRLVCPGTVDERVEQVVAGKRRIADLTLPRSSSVGDLDSDQLRRALGIDTDQVLTDASTTQVQGAAA